MSNTIKIQVKTDHPQTLTQLADFAAEQNSGFAGRRANLNGDKYWQEAANRIGNALALKQKPDLSRRGTQTPLSRLLSRSEAIKQLSNPKLTKNNDLKKQVASEIAAIMKEQALLLVDFCETIFTQATELGLTTGDSFGLRSDEAAELLYHKDGDKEYFHIANTGLDEGLEVCRDNSHAVGANLVVRRYSTHQNSKEIVLDQTENKLRARTVEAPWLKAINQDDSDEGTSVDICLGDLGSGPEDL